MSVVYFPRYGPFIKIGFSTCVPARLYSLRYYLSWAYGPEYSRLSVLTLLATEPGGAKEELLLHKRFAHHRKVGDVVQQILAGTEQFADLPGCVADWRQRLDGAA